MDLTQLSQMVSWLDEEHRRDREELARQDQRLQSMVIEKQEQERRIQDLESRLASTHAQLTKFTQLEQALQQLKNDVVALLDKHTESRLHAERETERSRMSDREAITRSVAEVRKELNRLGRIEEELATRAAEDQRLGEMVLALRQSVNNVGKDLDERTRTLPYMVEQRAHDNKRIAQLQAEHVELMKRTDSVATRIPLVEERLGRLDKELSRIQPISDQLRQDHQVFLEAQRIADADRTRQMVTYQTEIAQQRDLLEKQGLRLRDFETRYEAAGRALKAMDEFQVALVKDQKQVAELQRLAEERQRKELAEWQAENEQRWKKEVLRWDYQLGEQAKINAKTATRFVPTEKVVALLQREVDALWRVQEASGAQQLAGVQKVLDAIGAALDSRPKPEA